MSNESFSEIKSVTQPASSIGSKLRHARESVRLSAIDIARQLRLKPEYIDALEQDNYTNMPGATFAKGYLRAYARLVNLSGDELIAEFDRLKLMSDSNKPVIPKQQQSVFLLKEKPLRLVALIGLGLFIFIVLCWNFLSAKDTDDAATTMRQPLQNSALSGQSTAAQATLNSQNATATTQTTPPVPAEKSTAVSSANSTDSTKPTSVQNTSAPASDTKSALDTPTAKKQAKSADDEDNSDANVDSESEKPIKKSKKAKLAEPFE